MKNTDAHKLIQSWMTWGKTIKAPTLVPNYLEAFKRAEKTFLYQRVFDAEQGKLVTLTPILEGLDVSQMDFIGPYVYCFIYIY